MATGTAEKMEGMRAGVEGSGADGLWIPVVLIILVLLLVVLLVVYLKKQQGDETDSIEIGERGEDDIDLGAEQWELLHELSELISVPVERLTRNRKLFEKAVHEYLSEVSDFFPRPAPRCEAVAELRRALGFVQYDSPNLYSTRGLQTGDEVRLSVAYTRNSGPAEGTVQRVAEDFLEVNIDGGIQPGDEVAVVALSGAGRYSFNTNVVRAGENSGVCLLEHTTDLQRRERRSTRRVETHGPIYCRPSDPSQTEWQEMRIVDLSEGGVRIRGERITGEGTDMQGNKMDTRDMEVRFLPGDLFSDEIEDEEMQQWIWTTGRVVGVGHLGVDDYEYRLSFADADRQLERRLSKILYMLETREDEREA